MGDSSFNWRVREVYNLLDGEILASRGGGDGLAEPNLHAVSQHVEMMAQQFNALHDRYEQQWEANRAYRQRIETLEETLAQERYVVAQLEEQLNAESTIQHSLRMELETANAELENIRGALEVHDRLWRSRPSWEEMSDDPDIRENDRRLVATYMEGC